MSNYELYCCGSRGSRPVEGRRFNEFGGFTSCYVLKTDGYALIIDCGTGLYEANNIILDCQTVDIVLTHIHYDHILGMLDWDTLSQKSKITFYGGFDKWCGDRTFEEFFRKPFWPVQPSFILKNAPPTGTRLELRSDLSVEFYESPHPDDAQRIMIRMKEDRQEHTIAVMFDNETPEGIEKDILRDCDYMIYDGMYTDAEYAKRKGYGHSTWQEACRLAVRVNCKRLIVTHHSPFKTDEELRRYEQLAREIYPSTDFARSGQHWSFPCEATPAATVEKKRPKRWFTRMMEMLEEILLDNERLARLVWLGICILLGGISLLMTVVNIFTEKTLLMYATLIFAILCGLDGLISARVKKLYNAIQLLFQFQILILLTFFIVTGTPEGFSAIWALMLPAGGMLTFGKKRTTVLSAIMLGIILFFFDTTLGQSYLQYDYTDSFMLRFPMAFCAFYLLALFLETVREKLTAELKRLRETQALTIADQTAELRAQYFDIVRANSKLQLRNKALRNVIGDDLSDDEIRQMIDEEKE